MTVGPEIFMPIFPTQGTACQAVR